jgi:hypothetical protein
MDNRCVACLQLVFIFCLSLQVHAIENRWPQTVANEKVKEAYQIILERQADARGLEIYSTKLAKGRITVRELVLDFSVSQEFGDRFLNKLTPNEAVIFMYRKFLLREPENEKVISLKVSLMGDEGWRYVIEQLIESEEYIEKFGDNLIPGSQQK